MSFGDIVNGFGTAVNDLFQASGNAAQANDFQSAATLATQNAQLTAASTRVQETQTARQVTQTLGTQTADVAGAGFTESGSALDLLASSASQGALAKSLTNIQGAITENSYAAQAGAYSGESAAAKEASTGSTVGAIAALGGAVINGTGQLVSAGKTVVQGYNYLFGSSDSTAGVGAGLTDASQFTSGPADLTNVASQAQFLQPGIVSDTGLLSSTDTSIAHGSDLSGAFASTDVGIDTSGLSIGTGLDAADAGISDAVSSIGGDLIPGVGWIDAAAAIPGVNNIPVVGDVTSFVSQASNDIVSGAADFVNSAISAGEDVLSDVTFGLSVICTAFYKREMVSRNVWLGAQRFGQQLNPETFAGYVFWASPIAKRITKHSWFARLMAPVFIPPVNEMAYLMGQNNVRRTLYGFASHRVLLALSWVIGRMLVIMKEGENYADTAT